MGMRGRQVCRSGGRASCAAACVRLASRPREK